MLLFQFSRPQNLVMYWKFAIAVERVIFLDTDPSTMLIINENREMQRLYCSVDRAQLKRVSRKK